MPKTKIDVKAIVRESKEITQKIKEGLTTSTLTREESDSITKELEEVIALAEQIKSEIPNQKKVS